MMFMPFFSEFLYKSICCGYSFELHRQVDAIQMGTHSICLYKEVAKQYTSCNPKSTELLDCALIGVCAVIRSNMVHYTKATTCVINMVNFTWLAATAVNLGQVVQSVVSLTSSLRVISLTVLTDSIYNILIFFAEKM